jgi:AraC family transcriptional regulator of adaptative response/methylated-DNA-[protein]-cysteine methyltransferase
MEYLQARIADTKNLPDLTAEGRLSSPGQLQHLFVKLEAASPGESKAAGKGLSIGYGLHDTPFGQCLLATTPRGICHLQFLDAPSKNTDLQWLRLEWPQADILPDQQRTQPLCDRLFAPASVNNKPLALWVKGTSFQLQVWRALLQVPFGGMTTYENVAKAIGHPTAARAVGNAVGCNPVAYLIPCHRVLRASGALGGYRWGLGRKAALLAWEASWRERLGQDAP